jgi:hypothetical protein
MSSTRNRHASLMRSPAPYAAVKATAAARPLIAASTCATSLPLKITGCLRGTFGQGIRSASFARSSVTP